MRALPSRSGQSSVEADNAVGREGLGWSLFSEENEEPEVLVVPALPQGRSLVQLCGSKHMSGLELEMSKTCGRKCWAKGPEE